MIIVFAYSWWWWGSRYRSSGAAARRWRGCSRGPLRPRWCVNQLISWEYAHKYSRWAYCPQQYGAKWMLSIYFCTTQQGWFKWVSWHFMISFWCVNSFSNSNLQRHYISNVKKVNNKQCGVDCCRLCYCYWKAGSTLHEIDKVPTHSLYALVSIIWSF